MSCWSEVEHLLFVSGSYVVLNAVLLSHAFQHLLEVVLGGIYFRPVWLCHFTHTKILELRCLVKRQLLVHTRTVGDVFEWVVLLLLLGSSKRLAIQSHRAGTRLLLTLKELQVLQKVTRFIRNRGILVELVFICFLWDRVERHEGSLF